MEKTEERKIVASDQLVRCFVGAFIGLLAELLIIYGAASLITGDIVPMSGSVNLIILGAFAGASLSGYIGSRGQGSEMLGLGALSGLIFLLMSVLLGALFARDISLGLVVIKLGICSVMGGLFGGAISARPKKRRRSKRRR